MTLLAAILARLTDGLITNGPRAVGAIRDVTLTGSYVQLPSVACLGVVFTNTSGVDVTVRRGASGFAITIPNGSGKVMDVVANANELRVSGASGHIQFECNGEVV